MSAAPLAWVQAHGAGDLIGYSTLQGGLARYETSYGVWAYRHVLGMDITLGGPICAEHDIDRMIDGFLSRSRRPILCYLRESLVRRLEGRGLWCTGMGSDRRVDLPALLDTPPPPVRGALKKAARVGFRLSPLDLRALDDATRHRLEEISARYLARSECPHEMRFLNAPMRYEADGLRRVYTLHKHDREHDGVFGFVALNPVFTAGQAQDWLLDVLRFEPTRLWGVWTSVVYHVARILRAESAGFTLGFSPIHKWQPAPVARSRLLDAQADWMSRWLATATYVQRLRELKEGIPGHDEPRYFATFSREILSAFAALTEACGVGLRTVVGPDLLRVLRDGMSANLRLRPRAAS